MIIQRARDATFLGRAGIYTMKKDLVGKVFEKYLPDRVVETSTSNDKFFTAPSPEKVEVVLVTDGVFKEVRIKDVATGIRSWRYVDKFLEEYREVSNKTYL